MSAHIGRFAIKPLALAVIAVVAAAATSDAMAQRRGSTTTTTSTTPTTQVNPYSDPWFGIVWGELGWELSKALDDWGNPQTYVFEQSDFEKDCFSESGGCTQNLLNLTLSGTSLSSYWWETQDDAGTSLTEEFEPDEVADSTPPGNAPPPENAQGFPVDFRYNLFNGAEIPQVVDGQYVFNSAAFLAGEDVPLTVVFGGLPGPNSSPFSWKVTEDGSPTNIDGSAFGVLTEKTTEFLSFIETPDSNNSLDCPAGGVAVNSTDPDPNCILDLYGIKTSVGGLPLLTAPISTYAVLRFSSPGVIEGLAFVTNTFSIDGGEGGAPLPDNCVPSMGPANCNGASSRIVGENFRLVPEPGTVALLGLGLAGLGVARRRRTVADR